MRIFITLFQNDKEENEKSKSSSFTLSSIKIYLFLTVKKHFSHYKTQLCFLVT